MQFVSGASFVSTNANSAPGKTKNRETALLVTSTNTSDLTSGPLVRWCHRPLLASPPPGVNPPIMLEQPPCEMLSASTAVYGVLDQTTAVFTKRCCKLVSDQFSMFLGSTTASLIPRL